jgi:hypothetical protein
MDKSKMIIISVCLIFILAFGMTAGCSLKAGRATPETPTAYNSAGLVVNEIGVPVMTPKAKHT